MSDDDVIVVLGRAVPTVAAGPRAAGTVEAARTVTGTVNLTGIPGPPGPPGEQGEQGEPGPPGPAGTSTGHTHTQSVAAAVWSIVHDLGYQPNVTVIDSANEQVEGDVIYGPVGTVSIIFSAAFAGVAYLS